MASPVTRHTFGEIGKKARPINHDKKSHCVHLNGEPGKHKVFHKKDTKNRRQDKKHYDFPLK